MLSSMASNPLLISQNSHILRILTNNNVVDCLRLCNTQIAVHTAVSCIVLQFVLLTGGPQTSIK